VVINEEAYVVPDIASLYLFKTFKLLDRRMQIEVDSDNIFEYFVSQAPTEPQIKARGYPPLLQLLSPLTTVSTSR
jgi:hypothetical protein